VKVANGRMLTKVSASPTPAGSPMRLVHELRYFHHRGGLIQL